MSDGFIKIKGARVNNLKNINLDIPRGKMVVITGLSGSGKSSLAFDTLFAEGQRRFAESLSSYARQFLGRMSKPDVDSIDGIPPAISIEQKVTTRNPRSTVATTSEIYDHLRLIFSRIGRTFSPVSGKEVHKDSERDVLDCLKSLSERKGTAYLLSDLGWNGRNDKVELLLSLKEDGYSRLYATDASSAIASAVKIDEALQNGLENYSDAFLLVDRFRLEDNLSEPDKDLRMRLLSSISDAFGRGDGRIALEAEFSDGSVFRRDFNSRFELDGLQFMLPEDNLFSFNSPLGACPVCGGLGKIIGISEDLVVPDKTKCIYDGCIACWRGEKMGWFKDHLISVAERYGIPIFEPWCKLSEKVRRMIWDGDRSDGIPDDRRLIGISEFFEWVETQRYKIQFKYMLSRFSGRTNCHECGGSRLRKEALYVHVGGKTIRELLEMTVDSLLDFFENLNLDETEKLIVKDPLHEVVSRLEYIRDVGLGYLTLNRNCNTLSGGESQRVNLVSALGSSLVGSMYILDEPSVGLHPRDTQRLISILRKLRDLGNTVIVVEHDEEIIRAADLLIDMGPGAGEYGGEIVFEGRESEASDEDLRKSLTLRYLRGTEERYRRNVRPWQHFIEVQGAMEHNLKGIDVKFPLGALTVVTGVSGSGKSSLVGDILYPALSRILNNSSDLPGSHKSISGNLDRISKVEYVDQNPIGRSSRSNPVTYLKLWDLIRKLLSDQQYARINGFTPSTFSFNQDGGRCPECQGEGVVRIEMQFMADVTMVCEECGGKRFKPDVLEVRYHGKNVDDILNMSVDEAIEFFGSCPESESAEIVARLQPLVDVGLGYVKLGQSSSTLSGGESQRIKLAYFLSIGRKEHKNEKYFFIFDEPTTGLHYHDVKKLLKAFDSLLTEGHSIVVVEHNPDVIRCADWVIDLGPDAGENGGEVVFCGTAAELKNADCITAKFI